MGLKVLGLIPARGGSKGIPGKNIKLLNGRPLISYSIEVALASKYIDDVVVTTDSEEIAKLSRSFGAEVPFMRPPELAQDSSKTIDCVVHARDELIRLGRRPDVVVLLQPTSPLRSALDVDSALELFFREGCRGLVSVSKTEENPVLIRAMGIDGELKPLLDIPSTVRRQDMPEFYSVNGSIYINLADELTLETSLNDNPIGYVMPAKRSVDIDTIADFQEAEDRLKRSEEEGDRD